MTTKNTYEQSLDASQTQLANDVTQIIGEFKSLVVNIYVGNDSFSGRYNAMTNEVSLTDKKQADANKALKNMTNPQAEFVVYAPGETFTYTTNNSDFSKIGAKTHNDILDHYSATIQNLTEIPVLKIETVTEKEAPKPKI